VLERGVHGRQGKPVSAGPTIERCRECGEPEDRTFIPSVMEKMLERQLCHTCNFWTEWVERRDERATARIGGWHYRVHPMAKPSVPAHCKGFGGRLHKIVWDTGWTATTDNLWGQGEIPERFRDRLPDNATFVAVGAREVAAAVPSPVSGEDR
jgi:hypothetical protein